MTHVYTEDNANQIIQQEIQRNFHIHSGLEILNVRRIAVVGAYHGHEILDFLKQYPNCEILAFEPLAEPFAILQKRYSQVDRVKLFNCALSDVAGEADFYKLGNGGECSSSLLEFKGHEHGHHFFIEEVRKVPTLTLKECSKNLDIDLLWVDVQGAELKVLKGAPLNKIKSLFLEVHTHDFIKPWDEEPYKDQTYIEDLMEYLIPRKFNLKALGLNNKEGNGQGNSFWLKSE